MNEQQKSLFFIAYGNYCFINQARKRQNTLKRVSLRLSLCPNALKRVEAISDVFDIVLWDQPHLPVQVSL